MKNRIQVCFFYVGVVLTTCGTDPDAVPGVPMESMQASSSQSLRVPFTGGMDPSFGLIPGPPCPQHGTRLGVSPPSTGGSLFPSQIPRSTGGSGEYSLFGTTPTTTSGP